MENQENVRGMENVYGSWDYGMGGMCSVGCGRLYYYLQILAAPPHRQQAWPRELLAAEALEHHVLLSLLWQSAMFQKRSQSKDDVCEAETWPAHNGHAAGVRNNSVVVIG